MTKPANTTDTANTVADDQLRSFVERIMRMREEAKAINDDIREIYAEAKGNGFDKTVLGKVVLYVEKRSKDASAVQESDALFDLYLEAFDGGSSRAHAHTRESQPDHDPETGEIIEGDDAERQQRDAKGTTEAEERAHRVNVAAPAAGHPGAAHSRDADGQQRAADRATYPDMASASLNGIREPILMQGNVLLDGWSRYMAARELGIDYPVREYDGTDPLADIIKLNMASRSLNLAERVSIGRKLIKVAPDREGDIVDLLDVEQQREAAQ